MHLLNSATVPDQCNHLDLSGHIIICSGIYITHAAAGGSSFYSDKSCHECIVTTEKWNCDLTCSVTWYCEMCRLAKGKTCTICIDSMHAYSMCHHMDNKI